ncbi:MAG TPA: ATP-binding protein [Afifellaceae bacterium]|nr:ATP-binding protein [Afifellaceae bacterium]
MGDLPKAAVDWRALEESAEDLYEAAPCGYFSTLPNGQFVKINRTFLDWTGFNRESLLTGRRFQDLLTVAGKIYHDTHFGPLLQMQGRVSEIAFDIVCHDGRTLPVLVNAVEMKDEAGKPLLNRVTIFDATDRRAYERELLAARRKAEEIALAKADTLNMVSHDIRNLLTGIIGATRRLQSGELPPDQQQRYLGLLRASAENMMLLANNLLEVSRLEAGKLVLTEKRFDIKELVTAAMAPVIPAAETKGLDIRQRLDKGIPARLIADDIKLGQVLTNLLSNAVKFTERGFVELSVELIAERGDSVGLRLAVVDTGIGIEQSHLSTLTDAFSKASTDVGSRYGGAGLGLSLSRKILELYGSALQVESTRGSGSRFFFDLTLRRADDAQP